MIITSSLKFMIYLQVCSFLFPFCRNSLAATDPYLFKLVADAAEKSFNLHIALGGIVSRDCLRGQRLHQPRNRLSRRRLNACLNCPLMNYRRKIPFSVQRFRYCVQDYGSKFNVERSNQAPRRRTDPAHYHSPSGSVRIFIFKRSRRKSHSAWTKYWPRVRVRPGHDFRVGERRIHLVRDPPPRCSHL
jgi:hypothetical protein